MSVRLGMVYQTTFARVCWSGCREDKPVRLCFDENDDVVLEDVPDDLIGMASEIAARRGIDIEDLWRELLAQLVAPKTPVPEP